MREMKDSGVEWIGEIPSNWNVYRNKNAFVCSKELVGDKSSETQLLSLTTKGIRLKDINNAEGKLPESFDTYQYVKENELVMCLFDLDCSAVFSGISPYAGMISPAYRVLTCTNRMVPKYADYWFQYISHGRKFNHYAKNIRYTLSYEEFSSLPMLFPNIEEQKRISDYLDSKCAKIDSIIEKQQAITEKLKEYKLSVITDAVTKGLNSDVKLKDSGTEWFGEIPEACNITRSGHVYNIILGKMLSPEQKNKDDTFEKYYCAANVHFDGVSNDDLKRMWFSERDKQQYLVEKGDLLVVEGGAGAGGSAILLECNEENVYVQNSIMIVRGNTIVDNWWLYYTLYSLVKRNYIDFVCNKATIPHFTKDKLGNVPIVLFSDDEKESIINYLNTVCEKIDKTIEDRNKAIEKLQEYKKSLIYEVVTGKKEV